MQEERDGFAIRHRDELESSGNWLLVRRSLDCRAFGINLVRIAAGETIPEHDEIDRDQEELFFVVSGDATLVIDGDEHIAPEGTFARVDPMHRRTVRNRGELPVLLLIASAPQTSGYEPMDWA